MKAREGVICKGLFKPQPFLQARINDSCWGSKQYSKLISYTSGRETVQSLSFQVED